MSRIGKKPIAIPAGVDVKIEAGNLDTVTGPKGTATQQLNSKAIIKVEDSNIIVERFDETAESNAMHGLTRTLINNMVVGVTEGYEKRLEIVGT